MEKKQFKIICEKLDKITALLVIQSLQERDEKVYALKKLGLKSAEIAPLVGMTESGVRDNKGWKRR